MILQSEIDAQLSAADGSRDEFFAHVQRIQAITLQVDTPSLRGAKLMPTSHHVAHAYARAFGVPVVDGDKIAVTSADTINMRRVSVAVLTSPHSWNILHLPNGQSVILDLFPGSASSLVPTLVLSPHPNYVFHSDGLVARFVKERLSTSCNQEMVNCLVKEFIRVG